MARPRIPVDTAQIRELRALGFYGTRTIEIPAGSFITSYRSIAKECNISVEQARDAFDHLARTSGTTEAGRMKTVPPAEMILEVTGRPRLCGPRPARRICRIRDLGDAEEYFPKRTRAVHRWQSGDYMDRGAHPGSAAGA